MSEFRPVPTITGNGPREFIPGQGRAGESSFNATQQLIEWNKGKQNSGIPNLQESFAQMKNKTVTDIAFSYDKQKEKIIRSLRDSLAARGIVGGPLAAQLEYEITSEIDMRSAIEQSVAIARIDNQYAVMMADIGSQFGMRQMDYREQSKQRKQQREEDARAKAAELEASRIKANEMVETDKKKNQKNYAAALNDPEQRKAIMDLEAAIGDMVQKGRKGNADDYAACQAAAEKLRDWKQGTGVTEVPSIEELLKSKTDAGKYTGELDSKGNPVKDKTTTGAGTGGKQSDAMSGNSSTMPAFPGQNDSVYGAGTPVSGIANPSATVSGVTFNNQNILNVMKEAYASQPQTTGFKFIAKETPYSSQTIGV